MRKFNWFFLIAFFLLNSCDLFDNKLQDFLETYANHAIITHYDLDKSYPTFNNIPHISSDSDKKIRFEVDNEKNLLIDYTLTWNTSSPTSINPEKDRDYFINTQNRFVELTFPQAFLEQIENDTSMALLSGSIGLEHKETERLFPPFSFNFIVNTVPPQPAIAGVVKHTLSTDWVLAFDMVTLAQRQGLHSDIQAVRINGVDYSINIDSSSGTITSTSALKTTKPDGTATVYFDSLGQVYAHTNDTLYLETGTSITQKPAYSIAFVDSLGAVSNAIHVNSSGILRTDYYVSQFGSDSTGNGTENSPYISVQKAVDAIKMSPDNTADYTIHVKGTITEEGTLVAGGDSSDDGLVEIESDTELNITLKGLGTGSDEGIIDAKNLKGVLYISGSNTTVIISDNITITNGTSSLGAGVNIHSGTFEMTGGEITGNTDTGFFGGGGVLSNGTFIMSGGKITKNISTSASGGGVKSDGTFEMTGGEISGNTAGANGGGVVASGIFEMSGGKITGNTGKSFIGGGGSGGVYITASGTLKLKGNPTISTNVMNGTITNGVLSGGTTNNVQYVYTNELSRGKIEIVGALGSIAEIGILKHNLQGDNDVLVTAGEPIAGRGVYNPITDDDLARITRDDGGSLWLDTASNEVKIGLAPTVTPAYFTVEYYNGVSIATTADLETKVNVPVFDSTGLPTGLTVEKTVREHQKEERFLNYGEWKDPKLEFTQAQFEDFLVAVGAPVSTTVEEFVDIMVAANPSISVRKVNNNTLGLNLAVEYLEVANTAPFEGQIIFTHAVNPADMTTEVDMNYDGTSDGQLSTFATYPGATLDQNILTGSFSTKPELEAFIAKYTGYDGASNGSVINIFIDNYVHPITPPPDFEVDGSGILTKYNGSDVNVVIPSVDADGNSITGIGDGAFTSNTTIESVTIPDSITSLGESAFANAENLETVVIGTGVRTIKSNTFKNCGDLTTITIPTTVTVIESSAFIDCDDITTVHTNYTKKVDGTKGGINPYPTDWNHLGNEILFTKTWVFIPTDESQFDVDPAATYRITKYNGTDELIVIPSKKSSDTITEIGLSAFSSNANIKTVIIPSGVITLENQVFYNCANLTAVQIPDSVDTIGSFMFTYSTNVDKIFTNANKASPPTGWSTTNNSELFSSTWEPIP